MSISVCEYNRFLPDLTLLTLSDIIGGSCKVFALTADILNLDFRGFSFYSNYDSSRCCPRRCGCSDSLDA